MQSQEKSILLYSDCCSHDYSEITLFFASFWWIILDRIKSTAYDIYLSFHRRCHWVFSPVFLASDTWWIFRRWASWSDLFTMKQSQFKAWKRATYMLHLKACTNKCISLLENIVFMHFAVMSPCFYLSCLFYLWFCWLIMCNFLFLYTCFHLLFPVSFFLCFLLPLSLHDTVVTYVCICVFMF